MLGPGVFFQIVEPGETRAEGEQIGAAREHSAMVAGAHQTPGFVIPRERIFARLLLAGVEVIPPRLGDDLVAHDDGTVTVIGVLGPHFFAIGGGKSEQAPLGEFAGEELLPVMAVGIGPAQHQNIVAEQQGQLASAGSDFTAIGDIDRLFPELLAGAGVDRHRETEVLLFEFGLGFHRILRLQILVPRLVLEQDVLPLFRGDGAVDEVDRVIPHRHRLMFDGLAFVMPEMLAGGHVDREYSICRVLRAAAPATVFLLQLLPDRCGAV